MACFHGWIGGFTEIAELEQGQYLCQKHDKLRFHPEISLCLQAERGYKISFRVLKNLKHIPDDSEKLY